ncbi:hypothetical protein DASC09_047810 [Saccharomycopsis crataegensis]|uniref:Signal peptidase complex subunit 1 n=1 Tax=Saccharomycopsis crataegensis TaxID=43959 RepID=A0AAV5QSA0_9ASCO|nr:hypothetical protein DASC09_047810 [Saccharomycopsis crataegensis]
MSFSLADVTEYFTGTIDYKGQELATSILYKLLNFFALSSFLVGFVYQDIVYSVAIFGTGLVVIAVVISPPFKFYNKHNLKFLPVKNQVFSADTISDVVIEPIQQ